MNEDLEAEQVVTLSLLHGNSDFDLLTSAHQAGQIQILWDLKLYIIWSAFFKKKNVKSLI